MPQNLNNRSVEMTVAMARFIIQEAKAFIRHGFAQELDGSDLVNEVPIIDSIPEGETYRYVDHALRFIRYVGQVLAAALQTAYEGEDPHPLLEEGSDQFSVLDIVLGEEEI